MARVKFSALLSEVNGSVGAGCFQKYRGGSSLRNKPFPLGSLSQRQTTARVYVKQVQAAWAALTLAEQAEWGNFLSFNPCYQRHNSKVIVSGYCLFLKYNLLRLHAGLDILSSFTYTPLVYLPTEFSIVRAGAVFTVGFQEDFYDDVSYILLKLSPVKNNPTFSFKSRLRVIQLPYTGPAGQSQWDITDTYSDIFGYVPDSDDIMLASVLFFSAVAPIMGKEEFSIKTVS